MSELQIENDLVYIGIPIERFLIPEFITNRDEIQAALGRAGLATAILQAQGHRVDRNRDKIVKAFLTRSDKPDWLLMLDSDMEHPVDCALRLLAHRVPVVGALYFHRGTHDPLVFKEGVIRPDEYGRENQMWEFMQDEVYEYIEQAGIPMADRAFAVSSPVNPLLECDAIGTGCMLIHRSVLEAMEPPWFEYRTGARSEDLDFCYRVRRELGLPVYADLSTISGHYAMVPMGQAQFRATYRGRGVVFSNYTEGDAVTWLAKFGGFDSEEEADTAMSDYHPRQLAKLWEERGSISDLDFYRDPEVGRAYLLDLLWWNSSPLFRSFKSELVGAQSKKAIVFGGGIGTVAIQLAAQGCDVMMIEPNKILRDFAKSRWEWLKKNRIRGRKIGDIYFRARFPRGRPRDYKYDLGVAIDVLEHLEYSVLEGTMEMLSNNIKPGGRVFVHNNWEQQDLYPMHRDYSEAWDGLVKKYEFVQVGDLWLHRQ